MKIRNARRLAMVALAVAPIASALPASPASASTSGFLVVVGNAKLPTFPAANGTGGTFTSTAAAGATTDGRTVNGVTASFTYKEVCTAGEPLEGTADGTLNLDLSSGADVSASFHWQRVGLVAVLTGGGSGHTLVGAAVFVPSPLPACGSSATVNATVAGGGVLV
jgi:hypothetical protein